MLEADGKFYMVYHYTYNGENGWNDPVFPASEYTFALNYLQKLVDKDERYEWNSDTEIRRNLPGMYDYETFYIEELTMDEEI